MWWKYSIASKCQSQIYNTCIIEPNVQHTLFEYKAKTKQSIGNSSPRGVYINDYGHQHTRGKSPNDNNNGNKYTIFVVVRIVAQGKRERESKRYTRCFITL